MPKDANQFCTLVSSEGIHPGQSWGWRPLHSWDLLFGSNTRFECLLLAPGPGRQLSLAPTLRTSPCLCFPPSLPVTRDFKLLALDFVPRPVALPGW